MVLINFFSALIFFLLITVYIFWKRKKINYLLILLLCSLIPLWSIFRPGVYESGDLTLHIVHAMSFYSSLTTGILFPQWAANLNATYGYPAFIFSYPLPYYLISLIHLGGLSFILSIKVLIALSFIISGLTIYLWIKKELGAKAGLIAGIFYLYAPYHLIDMNFRTDIGELIMITLLPLYFLFLKTYSQTYSKKHYCLISFIFCLLILSHIELTFITIPLIILYSIYLWYTAKKRNKYFFIMLFLSIFSGLLLSLFYWLPALNEIQNTNQTIYSSIVFPNITSLFYSPWRWGFLYQGHYGELSPLIGYAQIFTFVIFIIYCFKKRFTKNQKYLSYFLFVIFCIYFFMLLSISYPVWKFFPMLSHLQFAYRVLLPVNIITSFMAALVLSKFKTQWIIIICSLTIFITILNWGNRGMISNVTDSSLTQTASLTTSKGLNIYQAIPIWVDAKHPWIDKIPNQHIEILSGKGVIKELSYSILKHEYIINANTQMTIKENTVYYPRWRLWVNNKIYSIQYQTKKYPGIITFILPKGKYLVILNFVTTPVQIFSRIISLFTFVFLIFLLLIDSKLINAKVLNIFR